jgi:uncharacterized membrane protein
MIAGMAILWLAIAGFLVAAAPDMAPPYSLFGVRVAPEFRKSRHGRRAIFRFRAAAGIGILGASGLIVAAGNTTAALAAPSIPIAAGIVAWFLEYRHLRRFALPRSKALHETAERSVEISTAPDGLPRWFRLTPLTFIVLGLVALYLWTSRDRIPTRIPVHWGIEGQPDRWAERTWPRVFGPLIMCAFLNAWLIGLSAAIWRGSRRSPYRAAAMQILAIVAGGMTVVFSSIAVAPVLATGGVGITLSALGLVAGLSVYAILKARRVREEPGAAEDTTDPACWHGGIVYFNPRDPAVFVPRRDGFGLTVNAARPEAWLVTLAPVMTIAASLFWLH